MRLRPVGWWKHISFKVANMHLLWFIFLDQWCDELIISRGALLRYFYPPLRIEIIKQFSHVNSCSLACEEMPPTLLFGWGILSTSQHLVSLFICPLMPRLWCNVVSGLVNLLQNIQNCFFWEPCDVSDPDGFQYPDLLWSLPSLWW